MRSSHGLIQLFSLVAAALKSGVGFQLLSQSSFENFIKTHEENGVMVNFCIGGTAPCESIGRELTRAATVLTEIPMKFASIDCVEDLELCKFYNIIAYPTIRIFRGLDSITRYRGLRKADFILSYLRKLHYPPILELDISSIEAFKSQDFGVLIAYLDGRDPAFFENFTAIAKSLPEGFLAGSISDTEAAEAESMEPPSIALYRSFGSEKFHFSGRFDQQVIADFIKSSISTSISELNPETWLPTLELGKPLAYIVTDIQPERHYLGILLDHVAKKYHESITFLTVDTYLVRSEAMSRKVPIDEIPPFIIHEPATNKIFPFPGATITAEAVDKFLETYLSGGLRNYGMVFGERQDDSVKAVKEVGARPAKDENLSQDKTHDEL